MNNNFPRFDLQGQIALVTGAARGIGNACALALSHAGADIALGLRDVNTGGELVSKIEAMGRRALPLQMDVTRLDEIKNAIDATVSHFGRLDILVNNAGISGLSLIDDIDDSKWYDIINTNLNGLYLVTKSVLKHMPDQAGGRIINISSVLGKFGVPGYAAYCTTKHGMIGFTRALALEVASRGITVNTICPGWVDTEMASLGINETAAHLGIMPEQFKAQAVDAVPIKRFLEADEIAEFVCYIASDAARGITGQAMNICGGQTMV